MTDALIAKKTTGTAASSKSLRILMDAYWLVDGPPSGKNVVRGIVRGWSETFPQDHVTLRLPSGSEDGLPKTVSQEFVGGIQGLNHAISVLTTRPDPRNYDVYLSQNFGGVSGELLKCVFLHDGIYKEHPEWFTRAERLYLRAIRPSLFRSRIIFTSSLAEEKRLERLWPRLTGKVQAVGLAVPHSLQDELPEKPERVQLNGRPFILSVGRLNVRKNLGLLIEAYGRSSASETHDLYIVGEPNGLAARQVVGVEKVQFLAGVTDAQLRWLYENAAAFVFPSLDEGFGLPLIEAAHFGLPIAASDIPPFREVGVAVDYFDPRSLEDIRVSLDNLTTNHKSSSKRNYAGWDKVVSAMRGRMLDELEAGSVDDCINS